VDVGDSAPDKDKSESIAEKPGVAPEKPNRPPMKLFMIGGGILLVVGLAVFFYWLHARHFISTNDAYITAHVHEISSREIGTVTEVLVDDNQKVQAGQVIVRLDPRDYQAALDQAKAGAAQTTAQLGQLQSSVGQAAAQATATVAQIDQTRSQITEQQAALQKAKLDYDRGVELFTKKVTAKAEIDAARATLLSAQGSLGAANAAFAAARAQAQSADAALLEAKANVKVGETNVAASAAKARAAALQLSYCDIVAPVAGKISKKTVEKGQSVQAGQALMAIVSPETWVIANFKESQLSRVAVGQRVDIRIDSLSRQTFIGTVDSIQEGSGATFSLLPSDNATGNFTKIVQRVPVKIVFDESSIRDFADRIVPGLSVVPSIDIDSLQDNRREAKRQTSELKQNAAQEKTR
jgi:membrane fusion protein (multidrug efflux system)